MSRETTSELVEIDATCHGCDWGSIATNALGNAVSNLGFQESVYMGKRSHATVGRKPTPTGAPKPARASCAPFPPAACLRRTMPGRRTDRAPSPTAW